MASLANELESEVAKSIREHFPKKVNSLGEAVRTMVFRDSGSTVLRVALSPSGSVSRDSSDGPVQMQKLYLAEEGQASGMLPDFAALVRRLKPRMAQVAASKKHSLKVKKNVSLGLAEFHFRPKARK